MILVTYIQNMKNIYIYIYIYHDKNKEGKAKRKMFNRIVAKWLTVARVPLTHFVFGK